MILGWLLSGSSCKEVATLGCHVSAVVQKVDVVGVS